MDTWRRWRLRNRWLLGSGAVVIVGLGLAVALGITVGGSEAEQGHAAGTNGGQQPSFVQYQDPQGRFAVSYPQGWQRVPSSDPQVALLLRTEPGAQDSMLVRIVPLSEPVTAAQLAGAKRITDRLVQASDVRILVQRQITLNGLPGYYYLYTFGKPGSDRFGVHAHYFLFSGSTMHVLVFQALPDTHFVELAPTFDRIARSYQVQPGEPSNPPPATGAPGGPSPGGPSPGGPSPGG